MNFYLQGISVHSYQIHDSSHCRSILASGHLEKGQGIQWRLGNCLHFQSNLRSRTCGYNDLSNRQGGGIFIHSIEEDNLASIQWSIKPLSTCYWVEVRHEHINCHVEVLLIQNISLYCLQASKLHVHGFYYGFQHWSHGTPKYQKEKRLWAIEENGRTSKNCTDPKIQSYPDAGNGRVLYGSIHAGMFDCFDEKLPQKQVEHSVLDPADWFPRVCGLCGVLLHERAIEKTCKGDIELGQQHHCSLYHKELNTSLQKIRNVSK